MSTQLTRLRLVTLGLTLALVAVACGAGGRNPQATKGHEKDVALRQVASSARETAPSALDDVTDSRLPRPLVNPQEIRSGGPPPDGIPAIDKPRFQKAGAVSWLHDREPVLALEVGNDARAYPVQVLVWHEIVNDTVAGVPVAVTYCPLCNTAIAFDRRVGARVLDFGTSGKLYNSDLVMYDRQTQSLWVQLLGQAVAGVLTGQRLEGFAVSTVSWVDWRRAHPAGWVLSRNTGFDRRYGANPYPGYDDVSTSPFLFEGKVDGRLAAKTRVVGIEEDGKAVAVVVDALRKQRVVEVALGDRALVVWLKPGTASALDADTVAGGQDLGATGVFDPLLDGRRLHFAPVPDGFRDRETGSAWDVLGRAVDGPREGRALTRVDHVDTFWFAWAAFRPTSAVVGGSDNR